MLGLAFLASRRSPDIHTKHGCVIADKDNRILGIGYNGWPAGMDDSTIPNNRPINPNDPNEESKYDWVLHGEENAILNANGTIRGTGATAYITGQPCQHCSLLMAQVGIKRFVIANRQGTLKETEKSKRQFKQLVTDKKIEVEYVTPDLTWIFNAFNQELLQWVPLKSLGQPNTIEGTLKKSWDVFAYSRIDKGWGYELIIANSPAYCGKVLHFNPDKQSSWHYHKLKDETFYVMSGGVHLYYGPDDRIDSERTIHAVLLPGDSFHVPVGLRHRIRAYPSNCAEIFEVSTQHFDEDSIRISPGD